MSIAATIENFDKKYRHEGGFEYFLKLYQQGLSSPEIGEHFHLEGRQVDYYLKRILGSDYIAYPYRKAMHDLGVGPRVDAGKL